MPAAQTPWRPRDTAYSGPDWQTRHSIAYELMFEYLRLSPSYELARREAEGTLSEADRALLPPDFDEVRGTYALLGDVQRTVWRTWWIANRFRVFGKIPPEVPVRELAAFSAGQGPTLSDDNLVWSLTTYLEEDRPAQGLPPALLLAVPLGMRRAEVLRQVARALDAHETDSPAAPAPLIELQGQRLRPDSLLAGIQLLCLRAEHPEWELWRLGTKAQLSPTNAALLKIDAPRKTAHEDEMYNREMVSKVTHRALVKAEATAENAARARFPSDAKVAQVPFDCATLGKAIQARDIWEIKERQRVLKDAMARAARYARARQL